MFVKLVNGVLEEAPVLLRDEEKTYSNPSEETLRAFGYKNYVELDMPEGEGKYFRSEYIENDTTITRGWVEYTPEEIEAQE